MSALHEVEPAAGPLRGTVVVPGDKSIAHRAVMFNAVARGKARVEGLPDGADVRSTLRVMRALGCSIQVKGETAVIEGSALRLAPPSAALDCGNSGTTMRLLAGLLAGQRFTSRLEGDASLSARPMERIARPLRAMGARIRTTDGHAPLTIEGARLHGAEHSLEVASAQLKSALLLAGLQADGRTTIREPARSRDHSERMLRAMGVALVREADLIGVDGLTVPAAVDVHVCGDVSSAAFFVVAATIVEDSEVTIEGVCLNPTRTAFLSLLCRMGADVTVIERGERAGEPFGDLRVVAAPLHGVEIGSGDIPGAIDEVPILAVAAASAAGRTVISGASELRVKESDRIATVVAMLRALGITVEEREDGMVIEGGPLRGGARIATGGDHRIVMSAAVAALGAERPVEIEDAGSAAVSFPGFFERMRALGT